MAGVPKISMTDVVADPSAHGYVAPLGVMFVKGWTRGVAALAIMACAFDKDEFHKAG